MTAPTAVGRGPPMTWVMPAQETPVDVGNANPWLVIDQAKQEILELRRTNQRLQELCGNSSSAWTHDPRDELTSGMRSGDRGDRSSKCCFDSERRLDTDRLRAEVERLRGQVDALKEATGQQREDIQKRDHTLSRYKFENDELEELRAEVCRSQTELGHARAELGQSRSEQERLGLELERIKRQEEGLAREAERARLEVQRRDAERERETEESCRLEVERLRETQRNLQTELQQLSTEHRAEVSALRQTSAALQDKLSHATQEIAGLERSLQQASEERDRLTEELSQVGNAYETQSTTLQRLRNYIGQLAPERQEEEKLSDTVQKLESEKQALQVTVELLTVRLNSLSDILSIQEKEMGDKILSDPLLKAGSKGSEVLRLWREKVFISLVQLRSKDIELRGERSKFLATISALEQEVKTQTNQASVFQHSLQDRIAELDLERVGRETVQQELSRTLAENEKQRVLSQEAGSALNAVTTAVHRFSVMFEDKVAEMHTAQKRLHSLGQRLTFAKGRVDTIQGLMMRKEALWKVQQASKPAEPAASERSSDDSLHAELALVCEERDSLVQELKRTPDLIERSLSEARVQFDSERTQLRQLLQQSRQKGLEAAGGPRGPGGGGEPLPGRAAAAGGPRGPGGAVGEPGAPARRAGQPAGAGREGTAGQEKVTLRRQKPAHWFTLQLRELESQLNTGARREHTKAVVTLRQAERQAERDRERLREERLLQEEQIQTKMQESQKLLQATDKDRNLLLATVHENGLLEQYKKARTTALHTSRGLGEQQPQGRPSRKAPPPGAKSKPITRDTFLSVLDELQTLSAAVIKDSSSDEDAGGGTSRPTEGTSQPPPHNV
ncbi:hypothetical protein AAFF_G00216150 [Aldrovandia affinis]|uniref:Coiled-coil alpha-helical rod protein 1 n=1 Tax=Aldrovandia affinis TaxID=143900 RepID=A0AAD7RGD6_9TELE|nr:hypothetical protein AAFF_G00216150 [Aldrovandia affinis]